MNTIVIYHGGCRDGFCAAWVVNKFLRQYDGISENNIIFFPGYYGQDPPDCKDKRVIIVDFAYEVGVMEKIVKEAKHTIWIDHHKTAEPVNMLFTSLENLNTYSMESYFRNDKSGAGLAWDYFFPHETRPWLVDYVEDRDLWAKKLDRTDEVNAYIACLEFDFKVWDVCSRYDRGKVADWGNIAIMKTEQYVREICKNVYFRNINQSNMRNENGRYIIAGRHYWCDIPVVNIPQVDCSEVLHELCKLYPDYPFSLYWFKRHDGLYQYGLRSIGDFDVSEVAKVFGGGGHKNAAGFQLPYLLEELK